jgi:hypothetical protein
MLADRTRMLFVVSLFGGIVGGAVGALVAAGPPVIAEDKSDVRIISAEEFRLVDKAGKTRAMLSFSAEGEPYLALLDGKESQRIWLGISSNPGLAIKDQKESKTRVLVSLDDTEGQPSVLLRNRQHQVLTLQPKGQ